MSNIDLSQEQMHRDAAPATRRTAAFSQPSRKHRILGLVQACLVFAAFAFVLVAVLGLLP